jgi:hypothetical protein
MLSPGSGLQDICTNATVNLSGKLFFPVECARRDTPRLYLDDACQDIKAGAGDVNV